MRTLADVLNLKGTGVVSVLSSATVLEAARVLAEKAVGSVLVVEDGAIVGIFSEHDAVRRVLAEGYRAATTLVSEVMTRDVAALSPETPVRDAMRLMTANRWRHLPIVVDGMVLGVVSIGDLAKCAACELDRSYVELARYVVGPSVECESEWPTTFLPAPSPAKDAPH